MDGVGDKEAKCNLVSAKYEHGRTSFQRALVVVGDIQRCYPRFDSRS